MRVPAVADREITIGSDVIMYKERLVRLVQSRYNFNGRLVRASVDKLKTYWKHQTGYGSSNAVTPSVNFDQ